MNPIVILSVIAGYFLVLMVISYFTGKDSSNDNFFLAGRQSPWYVVAFGMIGASLSGVTFISVPGWVGSAINEQGDLQQFAYMQVVFGYLLGYLFIATVLMPMYYRLNLTSIYSYLEQRFGIAAYQTGAGFFLLSRTIGAAFRLFIVAIVIQEFVMEELNVSFPVTVLITILLIWTYTFRGGIKTIVWTDTLQTFCMLLALVLTIIAIAGKLDISASGIWQTVAESDYSQIFFFEDGWSSKNNFFKQFLSGASIAIVMTGLDQDMMQKNLSCRNIGDAQKNMFSFSIVLVVANLLFLGLGALLFIYADQVGIEIPTRIVNGEVKTATDLLYPTMALKHLSPTVGVIFVLGLVAAAYSSADSALTALTTSFCVDFLGFEKKAVEETEEAEEATQAQQKRTRLFVHIGFSILLFFVILIFYYLNNRAVIEMIFKVASYTYGPLLGLFFFGFFTRRQILDNYAPIVCIASPIITFVLNYFSETLFFGYKFGFELLILNGLLTFIGLALISVPRQETQL